jgi:hypothetical protein
VATPYHLTPSPLGHDFNEYNSGQCQEAFKLWLSGSGKEDFSFIKEHVKNGSPFCSPILTLGAMSHPYTRAHVTSLHQGPCHILTPGAMSHPYTRGHVTSLHQGPCYILTPGAMSQSLHVNLNFFGLMVLKNNILKDFSYIQVIIYKNGLDFVKKLLCKSEFLRPSVLEKIFRSSYHNFALL